MRLVAFKLKRELGASLTRKIFRYLRYNLFIPIRFWFEYGQHYDFCCICRKFEMTYYNESVCKACAEFRWELQEFPKEKEKYLKELRRLKKKCILLENRIKASETE